MSIYDTPMTIGIVGSRTFANDPRTDMKMYKTVKKLVKKLHKESTIVSGGARGIDSYAEDCAYVRGMSKEIFRPDEKLPVPARFFARNTQIAQYLADNQPSVLIALMDETSSTGGTLDTIRKAKFRGVPCLEVYYSAAGNMKRYVDADDVLTEDE